MHDCLMRLPKLYGVISNVDKLFMEVWLVIPKHLGLGTAPKLWD